ncbi:MAG: efflux RND transporter periplasmic adaptor subunit [Chloroflexi bacterium]|nr:efflux RND transporter periplasmic adaptor subunit [Chloroflexota bacterium]
MSAQTSVPAARAAEDGAASQATAAAQEIVTARDNTAAPMAQEKPAIAAVTASRSELELARAEGLKTLFDGRASQESARQAASLLQYTEIRAPFAGVVTQRFLAPGALVQNTATSAPGASKLVLEVSSPDALRIVTHVPESDASFVHPVTVVDIFTPDSERPVIRTPVTGTSGALDPETREMAAEVDLQVSGGVLRPGMYVRVTVHLRSHYDALAVPMGAVVSDKDKRYLFVVKGVKAMRVSG